MGRISKLFILQEAPQGSNYENEYLRAKKQVDRIMIKLASDIKLAGNGGAAATAANYAAEDVSGVLRDLSQRVLARRKQDER